MEDRAKEILDAYYKRIDEIDFFDSDKWAFREGANWADMHPYILWHPVDTKKPKENQQVLIYTEKRAIMQGFFKDGTYWPEDYNPLDKKINITHWAEMINTPE